MSKLKITFLAFAFLTLGGLTPRAHASIDWTGSSAGGTTYVTTNDTITPPTSPGGGGTGSGCVGSPECPTAILGMLGLVGATLGTRLRRNGQGQAQAEALAQ